MAERRCKKCYQLVSGHRGKFGLNYCQNEPNPNFNRLMMNEIIFDKKKNGQITVEQVEVDNNGKVILHPIINNEAIAAFVTEVQDDLETTFQQTMYQKDVKELITTIGQASENQKGTLETIAKAMLNANETQT